MKPWQAIWQDEQECSNADCIQVQHLQLLLQPHAPRLMGGMKRVMRTHPCLQALNSYIAANTMSRGLLRQVNGMATHCGCWLLALRSC